MRSREPIGSDAALITDGELQYVVFDCFEDHELVHCMSTRMGGISTGECATLNLGFNRRDSRENVSENYQRLCKALDIDTQSMVFSKQVHGNNVRVVTRKDMGKGFSRESHMEGTDGLLTNIPGVTLVTFYADCVPLFFYDPVRKAAALVHSGWRSTYANIAGESVRRMVLEFGSNPEDIIVAIGPSIGSCCFEVGEDVYRLFAERYRNELFYTQTGNDKWKVNLQEIILSELLSEGLDPANIHNSGICTRCRNDLFFSHRGDHGSTGSLAAFMQLR